ncbi:MAG: choice-of-anchor Q domain-containing protein [Dehalococcoidia bacterium]
MVRAVSIALLILFCALSVQSAPPARAAAFAVDSVLDAVDAAAGDGVCATIEGDCTLRAALQETNALPGADTISLPFGTYELAIAGPDEDAAATGDLDILDDVTITGVDAATTIVDGGGLDRALDIDPLMTGVEVQLVGLTLRNGNAAVGGGLRNAAMLSIRDSVIASNHADAGGGINNRNEGTLDLHEVLVDGNSAGTAGGLQNEGIVTVRSSTFTENSSQDDGGAVINHGTLSATDSAFAGNTSGDNGGAFWGDGTLSLVDSTLINNTAADEGGAIVSFGGNVTLTRSAVEGNHAGRLRGGGLVNFGLSTMTLVDTRVRNNAAATNGGGILNNGTMTLERSTIDANTAGANGGGIHGDAGSSLSLLNSTISGNLAPAGGGISNGGTLTLAFSTIAFNAGTGVTITGEAHANGTIFANNTGANCQGLVQSEGHNLEDTSLCNFSSPGDLSGVDPQLEPLQPGLTATHPLGPGSEAIDAGGADCPATDQRGTARPQGVACDTGAFEVEQEGPQAGDVNGDGRIDSVDAALILQHTAGLLDTLAYPAAADVNHDGRVDSIDASLVLQFAAGLIDNLPA